MEGEGVNTVTTTGWLTKPATKAYTPGGMPKLTFDLMIAGDIGEEPTPWRCEIDRSNLIQKSEDLLVSGRSVIITAKLCGRPFKERDIQKGFTRFLRIQDIEFMKPDRAAVTESPEAVATE